MHILYYYPGQRATIFLETVDGYGARTDSASTPTVNRIIFPDLSLASGFPQDMVKLDTGLYYYQIVLPRGLTSLGSYAVDVEFTNPATETINNVIYQIIISVNFSNASASPG